MTSAPHGVIERWQPALDRIAPRTARGHSHLRLMWEPGEPWEPVERWLIWEVMPVDRAMDGVQMDLEGPPPRSFGRYDHALGKFKRTRSSFVSQRQWEFHRETGLYGRPIWVVQGTEGGHKRHWSEFEQNLVMLKTDNPEPMYPPAPGDLCYAEPDQRTIAMLHALDLVHAYGDLLHLSATHPHVLESLDRREKEAARDIAEQVWSWLHVQVEESMTLTRAMVNDIWDNANPDKAVPDYDGGTENFIEEVASAASF